MNETTLQKMKQMKFWGMARAFKATLEDGRLAALTTDEFTALLIDAESDERTNRRVERNIRSARFRYNASMEQLSFDIDRNMDKNQVMRFAECTFIDKGENILITGSTGSGKSYLASALGNHACTQGYKVYYTNMTKLFAKLKMHKADGSYLREISSMEKQDLLILDDFGIQPIDAQNRAALMDIIEDRHGKRSTIITSQVPVEGWYDVIGEKTMADAILDRLVHDAHRMELTGESLRRKQIPNNLKLSDPLNKIN